MYIAQMVTMWLRLSCYNEKRCRRLVGKPAPSRLTLPFLQGPIAWSVWGPHTPHCAPYTPRNVLRSLCEALAQCALPWHPEIPRDTKYTWYVDAAKS